MELYIANNNVSNLKDVGALHDMPKLIIADFSGNPLCANEAYRLYSVYNLRCAGGGRGGRARARVR